MTIEQIKIVNNIKFSILKAIDNIELEQMWEMIEKAYEQKEKDHCEDCISRAQALHACCDEWNKDYKAIMKSIRQLPSVTPTRPTGKWILEEVKDEDGRPYDIKYYCSKCQAERPPIWADYCSACGAEMEI